MERLDVAVLDARERAALVAVRSLGRRGLSVGAFAERDAPAFGSRWARATGLLDDYAGDVEAYVRSVLDLVERHAPRVLVPVHDGSIDALRRRRGELGATVLALAPDEQLEPALDKSRTFAVAADLGIRLPRMVGAAAPDAAAVAAEIGLPAVVKPVRSWDAGADHRLTSALASTVDELRAALAEVARAGVPAVVQEWVPGRREAVWLFRAGGAVRARFAQVAHRTCPPLGGVSVVRESIAPPVDVLEASEALLGEIGLDGFSEVEFRRDARDRPVLMEINPRLSASVELAVRAGVDFPALLYAWAADVPLPAVGGYRVGLRMRWLGGDLRWLRAVLRDGSVPGSPTPAGALARFAGDFLRPTSYDYLSLRDPAPALRASGDFLLRGLRSRKTPPVAPPTHEAAT